MDNGAGTPDKRPCEAVLSDPKRGRLVFDRNAIFRHPLRFLKVSGPILTAHHPFCSQYEGHTFTLGNRRWCIGCFFNSLSFFTAIAVLFIAFTLSVPFLDRDVLFYGGIIGVVLYFVLSIAGLTDNKVVKGLSKMLLGSSFAAFSFSVLMLGGDLLSNVGIKGIVIFGTYMIAATSMNVKRLLEMDRECQQCEYKMRWSRCPGFKDQVCAYIEEGFLIPKPPKPVSE
jgi:hypothetical protein